MRVDGELEQRRAGDAEAIGRAALHHARRLERLESVRDERGQQRTELGEGRRRPGLVDVDELIRLQPEHLPEVGARAPAAEQVADAGERVAASSEAPDELEPPKVRGAVDADAPAAAGWRQDPERLVLPDRPDRQADEPGQMVDRPLGLRRVVVVEALGCRHG
jgi:hypothetical protein